MTKEKFEKHLTQEEADQLHNLLNKLDSEMSQRMKKGDGAFDTGDVSYTTVVRNKRRRYLEAVYAVTDDRSSSDS